MVALVAAMNNDIAISCVHVKTERSMAQTGLLWPKTELNVAQSTSTLVGYNLDNHIFVFGDVSEPSLMQYYVNSAGPRFDDY